MEGGGRGITIECIKKVREMEKKGYEQPRRAKERPWLHWGRRGRKRIQIK